MTYEGDLLGVPNEMLFSEFFFLINLREGEMHLLKGYDVFVLGSKLRILINEARLKGPLHLLQKLIPLVFSSEELAQSCGQGIGSSSTIKLQEEGDIKKPLDNAKVQVFKGRTSNL